MHDRTTDTPTPRRQWLGTTLGATLGGLVVGACGGGGSAGTASTGSSTSTGSSSTSSTSTTSGTGSTSTSTALSTLALSSGTLSPAFDAATTAYTVTVANTTTALTVTATTADSSATLTVDGTAVASGSASAAVALAVGTTAITVVVTAADGSSRSYALTVTRPAAGSCTLTATETQGPFPLLAVLSNTAMVRSDIREGKTGVPLEVVLTVLDASAGCAPVAGAAVYIWHCDKDGLYSGYSQSGNAGQAGLTYLRGVQLSDANGQVRFTTVYPGWYAGRITHIHAQIYLNNHLAVTATATTQLAFPPAVTSAVYASSLYTKGQNTSVTSFAADNVFSDGTATELAALSGDVAGGYTAQLTVVIA